MVGTWAVSSQAKCCRISIKSLVMLGNVGNKPDRADTEKHLVLKTILHQNKLKKKQDTRAGRTLVAAVITAIGSQHLIPGVVAGVVGLFHALQDHVHRP
jgi:hypothetical protein